MASGGRTDHPATRTAVRSWNPDHPGGVDAHVTRIVGSRVGVTPEEAETLARRYLDGDPLAAFLGAIDPAGIVELRMRPERWYAVDEGA